MGTGTINSLTRHKDALIIKHKILDKDIKEAYTNHINDIELHRMKKEKLFIRIKSTMKKVYKVIKHLNKNKKCG